MEHHWKILERIWSPNLAPDAHLESRRCSGVLRYAESAGYTAGDHLYGLVPDMRHLADGLMKHESSRTHHLFLT